MELPSNYLSQAYPSLDLKVKIVAQILRHLKKNIPKIDKKQSNCGRIIEHQCFLIKTLEDCLRKTREEIVHIVI
jgi:hypothetical protein